jgi:hypothetical protein
MAVFLFGLRQSHNVVNAGKFVNAISMLLIILESFLTLLGAKVVI